MTKRLFCEISPFTYWLSVKKERFKRNAKDWLSKSKFAHSKSDPLPALIYQHKSLIRRTLGNTDMALQENKAVNLAIAAPRIDRIIIKPNETFSFWHLVGSCEKRKGYRSGLTISNGKVSQGIGGGMCQFTNLLHWMALHSPLDVLERHHHNTYDLFPDFGRQVPFGLGTSIMYNYLDYRLKNNTNNAFQFIVYTTNSHLCGELRAESPLPFNYHICTEDEHFVKSGEHYYRRNKIFRSIIDKKTGATIERELISESNARVYYDHSYIQEELLRTES